MNNSFLKEKAMKRPVSLALGLIVSTGFVLTSVSRAEEQAQSAAAEPIKVFVIAGDENVLDMGVVHSTQTKVLDSFQPLQAPAAGTKGGGNRLAEVSVYKGAYSATADYEALEPEVKAPVTLGEEVKRPRQKQPPTSTVEAFPELSQQEGYTTVVRATFAVEEPGHYEFHPGAGDSAFNVTLVNGQEVYRRDIADQQAKVTPVELEPGQRHGIKTIYFTKPNPAYEIIILDRPGTLESIVAKDPAYSFLKDKNGAWSTRDDVIVYDLHPILNNTKAVGHPLQVGDVPYGGATLRGMFGADLMFGHVMGDSVQEPVLIVRFATYDPIWFQRGSRSLGKDYLSPSAGGNPDLAGGWDVIHYNCGVWDASYREDGSKYYSGRQGEHTTSVADYEANLRVLFARLKKTGAAVIFSSTTPVWPGDPGRPNADVKQFNAVAEKVAREYGVIFEDLYAEVLRQGVGLTTNVHDVGNLAPHVTKTILDALAAREKSTTPLPRVLLIGDSITGTYQEQVTNNLDGKAVCYKNPGNGACSWNGLKNMDNWLDLKTYLQCGQEYHELIDGLRRILADPAAAFPGYKGQDVELAGFIWFQGILDSQSPSMSADYERNLSCFIKDIRGDLKNPNLPVVVTAMSSQAQRPEGNLAKAYQAQLAVGDATKHPEFADTVVSIECGNRPPDVKGVPLANDPKAYLELGRTWAQAMLQLLAHANGNTRGTAP